MDSLRIFVSGDSASSSFWEFRQMIPPWIFHKFVQRVSPGVLSLEDLFPGDLQKFLQISSEVFFEDSSEFLLGDSFCSFFWRFFQEWIFFHLGNPPSILYFLRFLQQFPVWFLIISFFGVSSGDFFKSFIWLLPLEFFRSLF